MSEEAGKTPDINELTRRVYGLAFDNGIRINLDDVANALALHAKRTSGKERGVLREPNIRRGKGEKQRAKKLADLLQLALDGQAASVSAEDLIARNSNTTWATETLQRPETESTREGFDWDKLSADLDVAFGASEGSASAWLRDANSEAGIAFRKVVRQAVGIENSEGIGRLRASIEEGGVGLTVAQIGILGIGLGYKLTEQKGELMRIDAQRPISFEHYSHVLKVRGADVDKFRSTYYGILQKLVLFGEYDSQEKTQTE